MLNLLKSTKWTLVCFVLSCLRGIILGFNFPLALVLLGFLGLQGLNHVLSNKKETKADDDVKAKINSLESKLALMSTTRRN